jgi:hypothetical protein
MDLGNLRAVVICSPSHSFCRRDPRMAVVATFGSAMLSVDSEKQQAFVSLLEMSLTCPQNGLIWEIKKPIGYTSSGYLSRYPA